MASSARIDELRKKFNENPRRYFAPLANEYRKIGDLDQAIFICQEYLPQQPGHMSGHIVYGQALFETGRLDEARAVFETALTLDPENLIALRHLGDIANGSGDTAAARSWYQRVLEADPGTKRSRPSSRRCSASRRLWPPLDARCRYRVTRPRSRGTARLALTTFQKLGSTNNHWSCRRIWCSSRPPRPKRPWSDPRPTRTPARGARGSPR